MDFIPPKIYFTLTFIIALLNINFPRSDFLTVCTTYHGNNFHNVTTAWKSASFHSLHFICLIKLQKLLFVTLYSDVMIKCVQSYPYAIKLSSLKSYSFVFPAWRNDTPFSHSSYCHFSVTSLSSNRPTSVFPVQLVILS